MVKSPTVLKFSCNCSYNFPVRLFHHGVSPTSKQLNVISPFSHFLSYLADIYALMTLLISNLSGKHVKKPLTKNLQLDQYLTSVIKHFAHTYYICI